MKLIKKIATLHVDKDGEQLNIVTEKEVFFFLQILPYLFRIFLYSFFPFSFNLVIIRLFQKSIKMITIRRYHYGSVRW